MTDAQPTCFDSSISKPFGEPVKDTPPEESILVPAIAPDVVFLRRFEAGAEPQRSAQYHHQLEPGNVSPGSVVRGSDYVLSPTVEQSARLDGPYPNFF